MELYSIISGGQTGVDRAALDAAMTLDIPCGGWCPKGRQAEDGVIPVKYPLLETDSAEYPDRTSRNVRDADATLIVTRGALEEGTALTRRFAVRQGKPHLVIDLDGNAAPEVILVWLKEHRVSILNIAGPRESQRPGIYAAAFALILDILTQLGTSPDNSRPHG